METEYVEYRDQTIVVDWQDDGTALLSTANGHAFDNDEFRKELEDARRAS